MSILTSKYNPLRFKDDLNYNFGKSDNCGYIQKFSKSDTLKIQFLANQGSVPQLVILSKDGESSAFEDLVLVQQFIGSDFLNLWVGSKPLEVLEEHGVYFVRVLNDDGFFSDMEPFMVFADGDRNLEDTLLIRYSNTYNKKGHIFRHAGDFQTSELRIDAVLVNFSPNLNAEVYQPQGVRSEVLKSDYRRNFQLTIGAGRGVADYMIDLFARIMTLDRKEIFLEGVFLPFEITDGDIEIIRVEQYNLSAGNIIITL